MPKFEITAPDGKRYEITAPDGTTADQALEHFKAQSSPSPQRQKEAANPFRRFLYGAGEVAVDAPAQMLYNAVPENVREPIDKADQWLYENTSGVLGSPPGGFNKKLSRTYEQYKKEAPEGTDYARIAGQIGGAYGLMRGLPMPQKFLPQLGANTAAGAAAGLLNPVYDENKDYWQQKGKQAGAGAGAGALLTPVTFGLSRFIAPKAASNPDIKRLESLGVKHITTGQRMGGAFNATEEKLGSLPLVGDLIRSKRSLSRDEFNNAIINKALSPIGKKVKGIGHEAVDEASELVSKAYDDALEGLKVVKLQPDDVNRINRLRGLASGLPEKEAKQFQRLYKQYVQKNISPAKAMTGETFKEIESKLSTEAAKFGKSTDVYQQNLGDAVHELLDSLRDAAAKTNPTYAKNLQKANSAYAQLVRVQDAARAAKTHGGVFTPSQLLNASQKADRSVRKNAIGRGKGLLQKEALSAQKVLGDKYPDSGTAGRVILDSIAAGGAGALGINFPYLIPPMAAGLAPYTAPGQAVINNLFLRRPEAIQPFAQQVANMIPSTTPALAVPLSGLLQQ